MRRSPSITPGPGLAALSCALLGLCFLGVATPGWSAELVNQAVGSCLENSNGAGIVDTCDGDSNQQWGWSADGEILAPDGRCLSFWFRTFDGDGNLVSISRHPIFDRTATVLYPCDGAEDQSWSFTEDGRILNFLDPVLSPFHEYLCLTYEPFGPTGGATRVVQEELNICDDAFAQWAIDLGGAGDANQLFGFENASDWSSPQASTFGVGAPVTEGTAALGVTAHGWIEIFSRSFDTTEAAGSGNRFAVDLYLPVEQPNPYWLGTFEMLVSVPSAGIYSEYLGFANLTGLATGTYHTFTFTMTQRVADAFNNGAPDAQVKFQLNVPTDATGTYRLDNLRRVP